MSDRVFRWLMTVPFVLTVITSLADLIGHAYLSFFG
jgi:hypothetical protein